MTDDGACGIQHQVLIIPQVWQTSFSSIASHSKASIKGYQWYQSLRNQKKHSKLISSSFQSSIMPKALPASSSLTWSLIFSINLPSGFFHRNTTQWQSRRGSWDSTKTQPLICHKWKQCEKPTIFLRVSKKMSPKSFLDSEVGRSNYPWIGKITV